MFETMNPPSDEDLMIDIQAGDQEAFRELMQRYERLLHCHIAQKLGGDWHTAHDISQKVFLKIFTKNETFIPGCKVQPWLYAIASNATVDYLRREKNIVARQVWIRKEKTVFLGIVWSPKRIIPLASVSKK